MKSPGKVRAALPLVAVWLAVVAASGCGGNGSSSVTGATPTTAGPSTTPPSTTPSSGGDVLPVATNPISNTSTAPGLTITKALVENNVSAQTGKPVDDHLEVALKNTGAAPLDHIAIYYRIADITKGTSEGYYTTLDGLTIAPGTTQIVHFDNAGGPSHYPVNRYSLYYTDKNQLRVDITASSPTVKIATFTVTKDAGGAEAGVE